MLSVDLDKLRILREIRKEAKCLVEMGYGGVRFEKEITEKEEKRDDIGGV